MGNKSFALFFNKLCGTSRIPLTDVYKTNKIAKQKISYYWLIENSTIFLFQTKTLSEFNTFKKNTISTKKFVLCFKKHILDGLKIIYSQVYTIPRMLWDSTGPHQMPWFSAWSICHRDNRILARKPCKRSQTRSEGNRRNRHQC